MPDMTNYSVDPVARTASVTYEFNTDEFTFPPTEVPAMAPGTITITDSYGETVTLRQSGRSFSVTSISKGTLTVNYSAIGGSTSPPPKGLTPWDDPAQLSGNWSDSVGPVFKDQISNQPLVYSNGAPPEVPFEGYSSIAEFTITRNRKINKTAAISLGSAHSGKVNSAAFSIMGLSVDKGEALCRYTFSMSYFSEDSASVTEYAQESIVIQYKKGGWKQAFADQGLKFLKDGRYNGLPLRDLDSGVPFGYNPAYPSAKVRDMGQYVRFSQIPFLLNGAGKPLPSQDLDGGATAFPSLGEAYDPNSAGNSPLINKALSTDTLVTLEFSDRKESDWGAALDLSYKLKDF